METIQTVMHIENAGQQDQESKQITQEYVNDLIDNQKFLPLNVSIQFLAQNWDIQNILDIAQAYVKKMQNEETKCDDSTLLIASYLCLNLNQVKSDFAATFQKALFSIFKLNQTYQEIILLKLSEYYNQSDKISQFALHLIKTLNGWLLGKQTRYLNLSSCIDDEIIDNLIRHKAIDNVCSTPQETYFQNIMKYLESSSEKISYYTKQKFGELIIPIPPGRVAAMLYNTGFVVDATKLTKDEILSATDQIHEFLPNQILYEYLNYMKGVQVFLKEKIKFKQSTEPVLQKFMFQHDWASKLNISNNHKVIQETLNQLYNATNPFLDCQYETDQFEPDEIQAIGKYLIFIEEFIQLDLNVNYDQSYELAFKFMSAIILYGKSIYKNDDILTKISDIILIASSEDKQKNNMYILLDSLMLKLDLNKFINMYVLPYIDTQVMQFYVISRLAMIISVCGIKDLNEKIGITNRDIIANLDLIYGGKKSTYEVMFEAIEDLNVKNNLFSLFASMRKMSYYLFVNVITNVLSVKPEDQLTSLFTIILRQLRLEQRLTTPPGVFLEQCSALFQEIMSQPVQLDKRNATNTPDVHMRKSVVIDDQPIDMTQSRLGKLSDSGLHTKETKHRESGIKKERTTIDEKLDTPGVERKAKDNSWDGMKESKIGGGVERLRKSFGSTADLQQQVSYNITQNPAKQYQQLIKPEDKAAFLAQMLASQAQPSTLLRYDFLQLLNKELISETNPQVLIAISELLTAFPSTLTARYCMSGILQLLIKKPTYSAGYRLLQALGSESLFTGTVTSRNNELAHAMSDGYEKAGQRIQGALLSFLTLEMDAFIGGVGEEMQGRLKANDFLRKLYKHAAQHRVSAEAAFGDFCRHCETLFDMTVGAPGARGGQSRAGSRSGGRGAPSSRPGSVLATPKTPTCQGAPKAAAYDANGHIVRPGARSPAPPQARDAPKSPSALNLRSLSQMQKLTKSVVQDTDQHASRPTSNNNGIRPINKYLERCKAMDFRRVYSLEYLKKQLQIASPGARLSTITGVFDVVRDAVKNLEKYEQQLDVLLQLILYFIRIQSEKDDMRASRVQRGDDQNDSETPRLSGPYQKLIEQLIKALKISSVLENRYVVYCAVYFILQILEFCGQQKQAIHLLLQSFYQQLDLDFWQAVSSFRLANFEDFIQTLILFNKSISYKPLDLSSDQMTSYYQIHFLVSNLSVNPNLHESFGEQVLVRSTANSTIQLAVGVTDNQTIHDTAVSIAQRLNINNVQALRHFLYSKNENKNGSQVGLMYDEQINMALDIFQPIFDHTQQVPGLKQSAQAMQKSLKQIKNEIIGQNMGLSKFIDEQQEEQQKIPVIEEQLLKSAVNIQSDEKIIEFVKKYRNYFELTSGFLEDKVKTSFITELNDIHILSEGKTLELFAGFLADVALEVIVKERELVDISISKLAEEANILSGNKHILVQLAKIILKNGEKLQNHNISVLKDALIRCLTNRDIQEQISTLQDAVTTLYMNDGIPDVNGSQVQFTQLGTAAGILIQSLSRTLSTASDDQKVLQQMRDVIRDTDEVSGQHQQFIRNTALHLFQGFVNSQQE